MHQLTLWLALLARSSEMFMMVCENRSFTEFALCILSAVLESEELCFYLVLSKVDACKEI
jgi:hypothetical protein